MDEIEQLKNMVVQLQNKMQVLESSYATHQHNETDGTKKLRKTIDLDQDQFLEVGYGGHASAPIVGLGTAAEQLAYAISVGKDDGRSGFVNKADILQMSFLHQTNTALDFIIAFKNPVSSLEGTSISTTSGGTTVTITGFGFTTNELAGRLIAIFNSSGTHIETQTVASNTATVITITGTWAASTSNAKFFIYYPVFMGSAETIYQRFYAQEGTAGGIRFGVGPTNGGQNGLLYMDATGDIYWRNKAGSSTKLN